MILDEWVEVGLGGCATTYYEDLGYKIPRRKDKDGRFLTPKKAKIVVKVSDLPEKSSVKVHVQCDYCKSVTLLSYNNYTRAVKKYGSYCCFNCRKEHTKITSNEVYGTDHPMQNSAVVSRAIETQRNKYGGFGYESQIIKDKCKATSLSRYGVEYPSSSKEIKEKTKLTNMKRYGVPYVLQNDSIRKKIMMTNFCKYGCKAPLQNADIREKCYSTNLERYGAKVPIQNPEIAKKTWNTVIERYGGIFMSSPIIAEKVQDTWLKKYGVPYVGGLEEIAEKRQQTMIERYGVDQTMKSEELKNKVFNTNIERYGTKSILHHDSSLYEEIRNKYTLSGAAPCSSQQQYIYNILSRKYSAALNYPLEGLSLDIFLSEYALAVEVDASGHWLQVDYGNISQAEFDAKQMKRDYFVKSKGINQIRIIMPTNQMPTNDTLLQIVSDSIIYFQETGHTWRNYYVDENLYKDAEHPEGCSFIMPTWNAKKLSSFSDEKIEELLSM